MLRTVEIYLKRLKLIPDVCELIMQFYYCRPPVAVFRKNMLEYRFLNRVYDTEGDNNPEFPDTSLALPINMLANMNNRSIQFTAVRNILSIQDRQCCLTNRIEFSSNISAVFGSGNLTVVAIDDPCNRHFNHMALIDTQNVSNMRTIFAVVMPGHEILRFIHNGKIITTRERHLIIYDWHFNPIAKIRDLYALSNFALINNRIIAQHSRFAQQTIYYTYYEVDLDNLTIVEINAAEVNEGDSQLPISPHSSDDDDFDEDEYVDQDENVDDELMQQ